MSKKVLICGVCNKEFEKPNARGRNPDTCSDCKAKKEDRVKEAKRLRENSDKSLSAVPILEPFEVASEVSKGDIVYIAPSLMSKDIMKRKYAIEYKVLSVNGPMIEVVRNLKSHYKNYPASVHFSRLLQKTGTEYLEILQDDGIMEDEEQEGINQ